LLLLCRRLQHSCLLILFQGLQHEAVVCSFAGRCFGDKRPQGQVAIPLMLAHVGGCCWGGGEWRVLLPQGQYVRRQRSEGRAVVPAVCTCLGQAGRQAGGCKGACGGLVCLMTAAERHECFLRLEGPLKSPAVRLQVKDTGHSRDECGIACAEVGGCPNPGTLLHHSTHPHTHLGRSTAGTTSRSSHQPHRRCRCSYVPCTSNGTRRVQAITGADVQRAGSKQGGCLRAALKCWEDIKCKGMCASRGSCDWLAKPRASHSIAYDTQQLRACCCTQSTLLVSTCQCCRKSGCLAH
jgi:hypothetical protein